MLVAVVIMVVGGHYFWGVMAQHKLDAALRGLHDSGEPIYPADFDSPAPAAGENAVDDLLAAGAIIHQRGEAAKAFDALEIALPLTDKEIAIIKAELAQRQKVIGLVASAARKPGVHWAIDHSVPSIMADAKGLTEARNVASTLQADALLAHQEGREGVALERIGQIRSIARIVDRQSDLIGHLVAAGIDALSADVGANLAPDLKVGGPGGVTPAQVRGVIDDLLDERSSHQGMIDALRGERRDGWQTVTRLLDGTFIVTLNSRGGKLGGGGGGGSIQLYVLRPLFLDDARLLVRASTEAKEAFEKSGDLPAFRAGFNSERLFPQVERRPALHMISAMLLPSYDRMIQTQYRLMTDQRLAATALAIRVFAAAHDGRLPASLDELVPTYLPAVPVDPMANGSAKLRYRAGGGDPMVYSVGDDARDDGGSEAAIHKVRAGEPVPRWSARDAVMHLKRQARYFPAVEE
jgi:hypothetical protein